MRASAVSALAAAAILVATPAHSQMAHPPGMSHAQVVQAASAGAPDAISQNATIAWVDSTGTAHQMRAGTNGFTCIIVVPDPFDGPVCGDQNAVAWVSAFLHHQPQPPTLSAPGIAYMAAGGSHFEDAQGNVMMMDQPGAHKVREQAHWMLIWPYDPAATGLPTRENGAGAYIMFAGTPWAHVMVYQDPRQMAAPARR